MITSWLFTIKAENNFSTLTRLPRRFQFLHKVKTFFHSLTLFSRPKDISSATFRQTFTSLEFRTPSSSSMSSDPDRPESPLYDERRSCADECTRPGDIAGPHYMSTCTLQSLNQLGTLCRISPEIIAVSIMPSPTESPEDHRSYYFCVYQVYFKGCGLTFPLPKALICYLEALGIALPQLTPNHLRTMMGIIIVAVKAEYIIGVPELNELLSMRSSSKKTSYFLAYQMLIETSSRTFLTRMKTDTILGSWLRTHLLRSETFPIRSHRSGPPNLVHIRLYISFVVNFLFY